VRGTPGAPINITHGGDATACRGGAGVEEELILPALAWVSVWTPYA